MKERKYTYKIRRTGESKGKNIQDNPSQDMVRWY